MYKIIDDKSSGKTSRLMLIAKENNATFVCDNPYGMELKARAYGIIGIDFISYSDYLNLTHEEKSNNKYVIDELEKFVTSQMGHIIGYTLSKD